MQIIFLSLLIVVTAAAQERAAPASPTVGLCKSQIENYCRVERDKKDLREIIKCLIKNDDKLSVECKQEIQRLVQASRQTAPPGGGPLGAIGGVTGASSQIPSLGYEGRSFSGNDGLNEHTDYFGFRKNYSERFLSCRSRASVFAQTAGTENVGPAGFTGLYGDKINTSTESFSLTANYMFPGSKESYWVLMLIMSNNSPLGTNIPLPGFFYIYRTPTFVGIFGLPVFSLQWTPVNPWAFSFSAFGPQLKSEVAYGAIDNTQFFTGLSWKQQRFILSERTNSKERLSFEEKNIEIGFRRPVWQGVLAELQTGYSFDRSVYLGEGLFNKSGGADGLQANWYLKWAVKAVF